MDVLYEENVTTAVAEVLAAAGVGRWDPMGVYGPGPVAAIYIRAAPDVPWPIITLSTYPVQVAVAPDDSILGLQIRTRTPNRDPRHTDRLDSLVLKTLHGKRGGALAGYRITQILFQSGASTGQDGSERWGRSANYYITGPR